MLTVACVLKTGGEYAPHHVEALARGVRRHLSIVHRFVCLTDVPADLPAGIEPIALPDPWRKWWGKICLFKKGLITGPVLFLDLDTIVVGPIDDIAMGHRFTVLENFWSPARIGSGLMAWDCDLSAIYDAFRTDPPRFMREYNTTEKWGDQGFIRFNSPQKWDLWQKRFPGRVVSWKKHCRDGVPAAASIVCFHGQPRPWMTPLWSEQWTRPS